VIAKKLIYKTEIYILHILKKYIRNISNIRYIYIYIYIYVMSINKLFIFFVKVLIVTLYKFVRYSIKWYVTPIRIQKMILFLLQKNVKDFTVNIGRLFFPSLEGFATVKRK